MVQGDARRGRLALGDAQRGVCRWGVRAWCRGMHGRGSVTGGSGHAGVQRRDMGGAGGIQAGGVRGGDGNGGVLGHRDSGPVPPGELKAVEARGSRCGAGAHSPREQGEVAPWVKQGSLWVQGSGTDGQEDGCDPS